MVSSKHQSALRNSLTFNLFTPFKNFFVQPSIVNPFPSLSLLDHPSSRQGFIYSIISFIIRMTLRRTDSLTFD